MDGNGNNGIVGISNLALAKQIKEFMKSSTELMASCYTFESGGMDIFVRDNQMQKFSWTEDPFQMAEPNGIRKSTYDVMTELIYKLIKDYEKPFGHTTFEIRYESKLEGRQLGNFYIRTKVCKHFKRL